MSQYTSISKDFYNGLWQQHEWSITKIIVTYQPISAGKNASKVLLPVTSKTATLILHSLCTIAKYLTEGLHIQQEIIFIPMHNRKQSM